MRRLFALTVLLFTLPAHGVTMDWVTVGDPGNACDTQPQGCFGAVAHVYLIAKYEVTNAEYAEFLNAVAATDTYDLYRMPMGNPNPGVHGHGGITQSGSPGSYTYTAIAGRENLPVNHVSFYDALRFANWLHNGQPTGAQDSTTTEDGAYTFSGPKSVGPRNPGATIFLSREDEWYKAAYFNGTSYFDYPTGTDTRTVCAAAGATANTANCNSAVGDVTEAGSYTGSESPYGTFDQGGNVWEWTETIDGSGRVTRGGGFGSGPYLLAAWSPDAGDPSYSNDIIGLRVASVPTGWVPDCSDGLDNDADGFTDYLDDPGCADHDDGSERSPDLVCDDGENNDADAFTDFPSDPGCFSPTSGIEDPKCQDGKDNDGDGAFDFDGGLSTLGYVAAEPDPQCTYGWQGREATLSCGLGAELALFLAPLTWLWRRRRA